MKKILFLAVAPLLLLADFDAVHDAVMYGKLEVLKAFIDEDPNSTHLPTTSGLTPLHIAIKVRNLEIAQYLLDMGADINAQDDYGVTPLHLAVKKKRLDLVRFLVLKKADINIKNISGITPLHQAAFSGEMPVVEFLHQMGANPNIRNEQNATPYDLAYAKGNLGIALYLKPYTK